MSILADIRQQFLKAVQQITDDPHELLAMTAPAQDSRFGDYQANFAMVLGKRLGKPPREVAQAVVDAVDFSEFCSSVEVAGPGFINLRLKDPWLIARLGDALADDRLGIARTSQPRVYVIDYSSVNVAKPMHVGHIRSTVIGDALYRTLKFLGHQVIGDNHLGDWGTQFGMIIYGYKHFLDEPAYAADPVKELARLYKLVNQLVSYHQLCEEAPELERDVQSRQEEIQQQQALVESCPTNEKKKATKDLKRLQKKLAEAQQDLEEAQQKIRRVDADATLAKLAREHCDIGRAVLEETAKLHAKDQQNLQLWETFLPLCRDDLQKVYDRLHVRFDHTLGESFYHDRLAQVVRSLQEHGLASASDGAVCVFLDEFETPMIVQKSDGAFLYATTDLATIEYRMENWRPDVMLYVVDHRQSEHFEKLFKAAQVWGAAESRPIPELRHIGFGTVLGPDNKPYKTKEGEAASLEDLLDEAIAKAFQVVSQNDDDKKTGAELSDPERRRISKVVGLGALKYADLSHNRTSDYKYDPDKMVALQGNTAAYMQYSYARIQSIFAKGNVDPDQLRSSGAPILFTNSYERQLGLEILRLAEGLEEMVVDYRPHLLTQWLFEGLSKRFSKFYENCNVLEPSPGRAGSTSELRNSRLMFCDLTARSIRLSLSLLGIDTVDKM